LPVTARSSSSASNTTGSLAVTKPSGLATGDLMIAWHVADNDGSLGSMGAPIGWDLLGQDGGASGADPFEKVWTRVATSGDVAASTFTFTNSTSSIYNSAAILAITTGTYDTTTPTSAVTFQSSGSNSTSHTAPAATGVVDGLLCTSHGSDTGGSAATYTPPSGMTEQEDTNSGSGSYTALEICTLVLTSTSTTGTKTATCSTSRPWKGSALVVNPSGGGGDAGGGTVTFLAATEDSRGTTNAPIVTPPAGISAGDLMLAIQVSDTRGTLAAMTAPAGWTLVASNTTRSGDVGFIKIWQKTVTGSEPADYTFNDSTAATSDACIVGLAGWDATDAFAADPTWNSGTSQTTHVAPTVNGVTGGVLLTIHVAGTAGTTRQYTSGPSGMTLAQDVFLSSSGYVTENVYYLALTATGGTGSKIATLSAAAPFVAASLVVQPPLDKNLLPSGISTGAAFGTPTVTVDPLPQTVTTVGIASAEAVGTATVTVDATAQTVTVTAGVTSGEAFGAPVVSVDLADQTVAVLGVGSSEAFGSPTVSLPQDVSPTGIATAEAFGSPVVAGAGGFGAAAFGTSPFGSGATDQTIVAVGIATGEAIGIPVMLPEQLVTPAGIFGAEAFGSPVVTVDLADQTIVAVGIDSGEVFGAPDVAGEPLVLPDGVATAEAFGSPVVTVDLAMQTVVGVGIPSDAVFGFPVITVPPNLPNLYPSVLLYPGSGIYPGVALDDPTDQTVSPAGIASTAVFGEPVVTAADGALTVVATGIDTTEAVGVPTVSATDEAFTITPDGIPSAEQFGDPSHMYIFLEVAPPVPTGQDTYYVEGIDLTGFAWRIETAEGLQNTPGVVGEDVVLPGRDGAVEVFGGFGQQRRADGIGQIVFSLWLKGVSASTGLIPGGSDTPTEYFARWDELVRIFHRRRVTIDHVKGDGTIRRAVAHLQPGDSIGPARNPSSPWFGRFKATFAIPGAHWTDTTTVTTGQQTLTTGGALSLAAFAGATAACTELTVVFGAGSNPRLSTAWGHVGWNNVISAGRQLGIDTATGTTNSAAGTSWTPGYDALTFAPGPRLFEVDPSEALTATLTHTGGGSMTVQVTGKRRYRTS